MKSASVTLLGKVSYTVERVLETFNILSKNLAWNKRPKGNSAYPHFALSSVSNAN